MSIIRIGTSGWMYDHWAEVFYPNDAFGYAVKNALRLKKLSD